MATKTTLLVGLLLVGSACATQLVAVIRERGEQLEELLCGCEELDGMIRVKDECVSQTMRNFDYGPLIKYLSGTATKVYVFLLQDICEKSQFNELSNKCESSVYGMDVRRKNDRTDLRHGLFRLEHACLQFCDTFPKRDKRHIEEFQEEVEALDRSPQLELKVHDDYLNLTSDMALRKFHEAIKLASKEKAIKMRIGNDVFDIRRADNDTDEGNSTDYLESRKGDIDEPDEDSNNQTQTATEAQDDLAKKEDPDVDATQSAKKDDSSQTEDPDVGAPPKVESSKTEDPPQKSDDSNDPIVGASEDVPQKATTNLHGTGVKIIDSPEKYSFDTYDTTKLYVNIAEEYRCKPKLDLYKQFLYMDEA